MDLFLLLFLSVMSILVGVILTLVLQYYVLLTYFKKNPTVEPPKKCSSQEYSLPEALRKEIENDEYDEKGGKSCSLSISLMLQFLFHELRHNDGVKRWLFKKLTLEFDELLTKTTIGKFFDSVTIRDMNLGSEFPNIKNISLENVKLDKSEGFIDTLNLFLNLDYTGNFSLSVDAKMKFGKTAYLAIKVKRISGAARLQFTRHPYTHWSFSFYNEPEMELAVESHFQGRQLQSNITNLIVNQIKKAIKRKHTLPNYKIRYKPFFIKTDPGQLDLDDSELIAQGQLEVSCVEATRLAALPGVQSVYCTITADSMPWISLYKKDNATYMVLELILTKLRQAQIGVIFKQETGIVTIDSITPSSPGARSGLKQGDVILAIEGKIVTTVQQISKFLKQLTHSNITFRVERVVDNYVIKAKAGTEEIKQQSVTNLECEEAEITQVEQDSFVIIDNVKPEPRKSKTIAGFKTPEKVPKIITGNENVSKIAQTIGNFALRKRKASIAERPSSATGTPQHMRQPSTVNLTDKKHSISEVPEIVRTNSESLDSELLSTTIETYKGQEVSLSSIVTFNDDYVFNLKEGYKYLNINVWGTIPGASDVLLGYANIPLAHILYECCSSMLGHYMKSYSFLPPNNIIPNSQSHPLMTHSGFEHVFCYGDVLLSFVWVHDDSLEMKQKTVTATVENPIVKFTAKHDFVRTQFHRTTHCDFCMKKIWLKDAVRCKECGMCCHKKCIAKCQISTECLPIDKVNLDAGDLQTDVNETNEETIEQLPGGLKRVNSVSNLTIPGSILISNQSRSLPPSPQRTPSRKQSLANVNPFLMCPETLDEVNAKPSETSECITRLLDQIMACHVDESLMDMAKESGQQLYSTMPHQEKTDKINTMVAALKEYLDTITMEHIELTSKMATEESDVERARLAFLIGQADAKVHALSVLMLHYCSSLQHTQEKIV